VRRPSQFEAIALVNLGRKIFTLSESWEHQFLWQMTRFREMILRASRTHSWTDEHLCGYITWRLWNRYCVWLGLPAHYHLIGSHELPLRPAGALCCHFRWEQLSMSMEDVSLAAVVYCRFVYDADSVQYSCEGFCPVLHCRLLQEDVCFCHKNYLSFEMRLKYRCFTKRFTT
jgi:hypothetical protein